MDDRLYRHGSAMDSSNSCPQQTHNDTDAPVIHNIHSAKTAAFPYQRVLPK